MPTTYSTAPVEVLRICDRVLEGTFPDLHALEIVVDVLMASNDSGPPVKVHGVPALAKIKVRNLEDRIQGLGDVKIVIDEGRWAELSEPQREALFDHELTHIAVLKDDSGAVKRDDAGRPRLKLRSHDFELGGFWETVERRKESAPEAAVFDSIARGFSQREFPWGMV